MQIFIKSGNTGLCCESQLAMDIFEKSKARKKCKMKCRKKVFCYHKEADNFLPFPELASTKAPALAIATTM
jgi:hypothetical protein